MGFDASILPSKLRPWECCQTQRDSSKIKCVLLSSYIQDVGRSLLVGFLHHKESEVLKDYVVTILILICKSCFSYDIISQSKMVLFTSMCLKSNNHIAQTLAITQLAEHHCKLLVPARELLYVSITIVFANVVVKLCPVHNSC